MRLVLLGTTGYHPSDSRQTACMTLPDCGVVLDAGTAMYRLRDYLQLTTLDIFLTHTHLDHIIGLTFLFDVLHEKAVQHVRVHGEHEKIVAVQEHLFCKALFPAMPPIEWHDLDGPAELPNQTRLTYFPLKHPGGSVGFRLDWADRSMAYVTDTTATTDADYVEKIRGVDLLVHECYFPDGMESQAELTGHSCTTPVAQVARAADVGRLILVHTNPLDNTDDPVGINVARAIFPKTELGTDRMELDF